VQCGFPFKIGELIYRIARVNAGFNGFFIQTLSGIY